MKKNKNLNIDNIDQDLVSNDADKTNPSIDIHNNTDNSIHPSIRKTKTTKSPKKEKNGKKSKSPNRIKKSPKKNHKKVKFIDKVDIIKVECWKQYNLEQTADECEFVDDYLDEFVTAKNNNNNNKINNNSDKDSKDDKNTTNNEIKKKEKIRNKNNKKIGKGKKGNYTCTCIII